MTLPPVPALPRRRIILAGGQAAVGAVAATLLAPAGAVAAGHGRAAPTLTGPADSWQDPRDVALRWHDVTLAAVAAAAYPEPVTASRTWAVSWLAAAQAVRDAGDGAASIAAFATALRDTLIALVPAARRRVEAELAATLRRVPTGPAREHGIAAGRARAAALLAQRDGDGLSAAAVDVPWTPPTPRPGVWRPTPPTFGAAVRAGEGKAKAFLLADNHQFRPGGPPALTSRRYLDALAEVRAVGAVASRVRSASQTDIARFWEQNSIDAYVQVLRALLAQPGGSLAGRARLVAAFHVITIDAQIAIYDAKYAYAFWRPVTAIRAAASGADPSWTPFFATPRHPDYPSGHAGYAGAAEAALSALVGPGPAAPIAVTSGTAPGSVRHFARWAAITQENVDGRVWEGIHFRFSDEVGVQLGQQVARHGLRHLAVIGL